MICRRLKSKEDGARKVAVHGRSRLGQGQEIYVIAVPCPRRRQTVSFPQHSSQLQVYGCLIDVVTHRPNPGPPHHFQRTTPVRTHSRSPQHTPLHSPVVRTLDRMGADLSKPVFSHGQLYTALSRIRRSLRDHGLLLLPRGQTTTKNVTYVELLQ